MRKFLIIVMVVAGVGGLGAAGVYASQNMSIGGGESLNFGFNTPQKATEVRYDVDTSDKERLFKKAPKSAKKSVWE